MAAPNFRLSHLDEMMFWRTHKINGKKLLQILYNIIFTINCNWNCKFI